MINAILVFNNHGKPRLVRFYQHLAEELQQQIIRETFHLVLKRDDHICNFLECGSLFGGSDYKLIYRHYATLYFVFCVDSSESELGILDLIQVFVETLDKCFENVCELDLIFHMDKPAEGSARDGAVHVGGAGAVPAPGHLWTHLGDGALMVTLFVPGLRPGSQAEESTLLWALWPGNGVWRLCCPPGLFTFHSSPAPVLALLIFLFLACFSSWDVLFLSSCAFQSLAAGSPHLAGGGDRWHGAGDQHE
ncbi:AP-3 complex subunit sigma-2 isoform X1 [Apus apus]|uniref:AP-3 complex subunit sigma-2 isoform X1 n=1 Tax=Apus apus TaxID=8895 RepID=UPI0021F81BD8|nr:AP-3 complex subunit sigma-2 isoform X1 [Apus apus]